MDYKFAIDLQNVHLSLEGNAGPVDILHSIDLQITQGRSCALVGPSGSGKSSLLMVMAGLEQATSGRVTVLGEDISAMSEAELAQFRRGRVGVVFQSFHLIPSMTALQNVATALELAGEPNPFDRAREKLTALGLAHRCDHFPKQMSGGEQQRVALARALAPNPKLVFADEPTGNLDAATGDEDQSCIGLLMGQGKQAIDNTGSRGRIQIACGLICKDELGIGGQGAR